MLVTQLCICQNLQNYTLKIVHFTVCKLHFDETWKREKKKKTVSWDTISVRTLGELIWGEGGANWRLMVSDQMADEFQITSALSQLKGMSSTLSNY